jgi:hypothetical protein
MKPKLILCLALVLSGGLFGYFSPWSPARRRKPAHDLGSMSGNINPLTPSEIHDIEQYEITNRMRSMTNGQTNSLP